MRRLTQDEYAATIQDLLGMPLPPNLSFVPDEEAGFFRNDAAALTTSPVLIEQYLTAGEALAAQALVPTALARLLPCAASQSDACASQFIAAFGKRAWRRPLDAGEIDALTARFRQGKASGGFAGGIELVLRSLLLSPAFIFRIEIGVAAEDRPGWLRPSSFEMASRLSYLLWNSMPDAVLLDAADRDALRTRAQIAAQAARMIALERARAPVARFFDQWLALREVDQIDKDKAVYPAWNPELVALFRQELNAFLDDAVFRADGTVAGLFASARSFMNRTLATFYGTPGPTGAAFQAVALDGNKRAGLLSLGGLMARLAETNDTSPILRGAFVRQRVLCQPLPPPPSGVDNSPPRPSKVATTRDRYRQHSADPTCASCHRLIDPIGFGFEHFDGIGLWRDSDNGRPIDDAGEVTDHPLGAFKGVSDLARKLAVSPDATACLARQALTFALGRPIGDGDGAAGAVLDRAFPAGKGRLKDLLLAITDTDPFLFIPRDTGAGR
jgi:hypothetical protein